VTWKRIAILATLTAGIAAVVLVLRGRKAPHTIVEGETDETVQFTKPVLIINPGSGSGKAAKIGLAASAEALGVETIVRVKGQKIQDLARQAVADGCDHLMIAGGDGSLARVAGVAIELGVPFSCVPSGTRNHFAMDLGLDRADPTKALNAAFEGVPVNVDVGRINKRIFLNNVSFGVYADAIADPNYREDRAKSLVEATADTATATKSSFSVTDSEGTVHDDIGMLLASNNPYRFIGAPDFAGRARLDTGLVGVVMEDTVGAAKAHSHREVKRKSTEVLTIDSDDKKVHVGIDGSLHKVKSPVAVRIDNRSLQVVLPSGVVQRQLQGDASPTEEALSFLSGLRQSSESSN
jgi:diacylglycerol kinase family enzyme